MTTTMRTVALLATIALACEAVNYCSICKDHTLCKNQNIQTKCKDVKSSGVDNKNRKIIEDLHNKLRTIVATGKETRGTSGSQPAASNMRALTWDSELAKIAQQWANQCNFGHDKCRDVERFSVGQNVFKSYSSRGDPKSPDWEKAINSWYDEVASFNRNDVQKFKSSSKTGHYTQVVWAETTKVGCGFVSYMANKMNHKYYVCNYGEAGNWIGRTVYKEGNACSSCPQKTTCNGHGLCH